MKNQLKITAKPNYSKRTFTIKKCGSVYRTEKFSKEIFDYLLYNTELDWYEYLKKSLSYYLVK